MSLLQNTEICSVIFSILFLVKSLRNSNITTITYKTDVQYSDKENSHNIYRNNSIIYIKNWNTLGNKKYKSSQKWQIVNVDENNNYSVIQ